MPGKRSSRTQPVDRATVTRTVGRADSDSTTQVLSRAQSGDRAAVQTLIERALPPLRRWAHNRIPRDGRGSADTEDVLQDAVLRTLKRLSTFEHRNVDAMQRYLRKAIVNKIRDIARQVRRRGVPSELPESLPDSEMSPENRTILAQRTEEFADALGRLSPADRQVIIWRFEFGYSTDEIADRLGKSVDATHMMISRARKRLIAAHAETTMSRSASDSPRRGS